MKNKFMVSILAIGLGMSFANPAFSITCADEFDMCLENGGAFYQCKRDFKRCLTQERPACEIY